MLIRIEKLLWIAGLYLLLVCASILAARSVASHALLADWSERAAQHQSAMAAVEPVDLQSTQAALQSAAEYESGTPAAMPVASTTLDGGFAAPAPDQSDWSQTRKNAYRPDTATSLRPIGLLRIPTIGVTAPIVPGTDDDALNVGVGWLDRTAALGADGNAALAAHRDSFFRRLGELQEGDTVLVDTLDGEIAYVVTSHRIVAPDDVAVLAQTPDATLTLITCYPFRYVGNAPQRYIVHAKRASHYLQT